MQCTSALSLFHLTFFPKLIVSIIKNVVINPLQISSIQLIDSFYSLFLYILLSYILPRMINLSRIYQIFPRLHEQIILIVIFHQNLVLGFCFVYFHRCRHKTSVHTYFRPLHILVICINLSNRLAV